ncbi:MAG: hypothetical protein U0401_23370 [Anaerolineae bacterium]
MQTGVWGGYLRVQRRGHKQLRRVACPPSLESIAAILAVRAGAMEEIPARRRWDCVWLSCGTHCKLRRLGRAAGAVWGLTVGSGLLPRNLFTSQNRPLPQPLPASGRRGEAPLPYGEGAGGWV